MNENLIYITISGLLLTACVIYQEIQIRRIQKDAKESDIAILQIADALAGSPYCACAACRLRRTIKEAREKSERLREGAKAAPAEEEKKS